MSRLAIQACGMTTAIGLTGPAAAAAQRARLSRFEETHFISRDGKWMIGAEVPLDPPKRGRARFQPIHDSSAVITYGRVGGVVALRDAHSYLLAGTLAHYDHDDRVLTEANSNGFPAGEAGAAVLVGTGGGLQLLGLGFGREEAHITSGEPFRADGLVKAMRDALGEAGCCVNVVIRWICGTPPANLATPVRQACH